jgi:hypothetical protein
MLKAKKSLEQYLGEQCEKIVLDNGVCKRIYDYANENYDIPKGMVSDLITMRVSLSEASEFVLFILLDTIEKVTEQKKSVIDQFYTMQEVQQYRKSKYEVDKIKFPLVFKMIQVADDQWTGSIDVKALMKLRAAQLINYNTNAQRTMQKIVKGDKEFYKITLNQKSVNDIAESFRNNTFIPNPLTLNVPMETDFDFYYDKDTCSLVIKSLEHLDIVDGFHRYIAACQISDADNSFNYPMELRIINFSEDKAKQFIYQEDQKTKMRKIDSNSLNMNKASNIIVTRLNENVRCNLKGLISRNDGIVPFGELAELVDYFYFKEYQLKGKENKIIIQAVNELTENFNILTEYDTTYLEKSWDYRTLLTVMFCFDYFKDKDKTEMCRVINDAAKLVRESDNKKFYSKVPRKSLMNEVEKIVKEVM